MFRIYKQDLNSNWSWVKGEDYGISDFITFREPPTCGTFQDEEHGNSIVIFMDASTHVLHLEKCILQGKECKWINKINTYHPYTRYRIN